jgi:hypothetical protein
MNKDKQEIVNSFIPYLTANTEQLIEIGKMEVQSVKLLEHVAANADTNHLYFLEEAQKHLQLFVYYSQLAIKSNPRNPKK